MGNELIELIRPELPQEWDYESSTKKVKRLIYKWKDMTLELAHELWIAREMLSIEGRNWNKSSSKKTWSEYCEEIGSSRQVVNRWLKQWFKIEEESKQLTPPLPSDRYRVIYADPPWKYSDKLIEGYGAAEHHYPAMSIDELCALNVKELADDNSVLFLWVTSPFLDECFSVISAWTFEYKASFIWDKIGHNYGHYNSVRHEFLLVCTRGSCTPDSKELKDSVVSEEKSRLHSEKPQIFRDIIDDLYPTGKRIELFARSKPNGWDIWGAEAPA